MPLSAKDRQGLLLIGAIGAVMIGIGAFAYDRSNDPKPGEDNCIAPVTAKTVIVLDHSEGVTDQGAAEIRQRALAHISNRAATNEQVTVFSITDLSQKSLKPLFSACKPPSTGNRMVENQKQIERRYREGFIQPLEAALASPIPGSKQSPIAEALIDLSLSDYLRAERASLVVFSDMLQNSSALRMYDCRNSNSGIERFRTSRAGAQERPEFHNTDVTLNIVPRAGLAPDVVECRTGYWAWFFGDNEGSNAGLTSSFLPGGAAQ